MLVGPDGKPLGAEHVKAPPVAGFVVLRQDPHTLVPLATDKGNLAIFPSAEEAVKAAQAIADAELRPNKDQKVVAPRMKSHEYLICALPVLGKAQATLKNPEQILAPGGKLNG